MGDFIPPAPSDLQVHMDQFVDWLNSEEASALHPIEFAALAHYRLVAIHPFFDGNGRTSRLLMNVILMQAGFPPVSIEVGDRLTYYETLELANNGDIRPFIRFISRCTERTLDEYLFLLKDDAEFSLPSAYKRRNSNNRDRVIYVDVNDDSMESEDSEEEKDIGTTKNHIDSDNIRLMQCSNEEKSRENAECPLENHITESNKFEEVYS